LDRVALVVGGELLEQVAHGRGEGLPIIGTALPRAHRGASRIRVDPSPHRHAPTLPRSAARPPPKSRIAAPESRTGAAYLAPCASPAHISHIRFLIWDPRGASACDVRARGAATPGSLCE